MKRQFWKVCKKLANEERVDVLRQVLCAPSSEGISVGAVSDMVRLEQPATSAYLAQLQGECGLIAASRQGRYCIYRGEPDYSDANATVLLPALKEYFRAECRCFASFNGRRPPAPGFLSVLPALANESRVHVVRFLRAAGRADKWDIIKATGITELNVRRHLACLVECMLVEPDGGKVAWREPEDDLSRLFIKLAIAQ